MEIEAKFSVPDEQTLRRLREVTVLARFRLGDLTSRELHDIYMDTVGWRFRAQGYGYRLRRAGDSYLASIKGLGGARGAVHKRIECQVALSEPLPPQQWPSGPARTLALRLCGGEPLVPLFEVRQTRDSRLLRAGDRAIAVSSLDRVSLFDREGRGPIDSYLELEVELLPDGTEDDLRSLVRMLREEWALAAEERSKYERGLAVLYGAGAGTTQ